VYGPHDDVETKCLWDDLVGLMSLWEVSWCIEGHFNVRFPSERSGDPRQSLATLDFLAFILYQGLMDIALGGENFTWSNNRDSQAWSRIDRFLLSLD
jgi:hypothetical protein